MNSKILGKVGILLTLATGAFAQTPGSAVQQATDLAAYRAGMGSAVNLAKSNDLTAAEMTLIPLSTTKPNTGERRIEIAQRLVQLAEQLARDGQTRNVTALVNRALQHLGEAEVRAANARVRAEAKTIAGFIYHRFLANHAAALASYTAAVQLSPATALQAREAAERLRAVEETVKARNSGN